MTLTELSYYSRKVAPYAVAGVLFFVLGYFLIQSIFGYIESKKVIPLAIDPIFNKLPKLDIKNKIAYPLDAHITLDNIEGRPVSATESARVFYLPLGSTRLGYLQNIYLAAKNLGFDTDITKHKANDTEAIFENNEQKYSVNIINFNFEYKYNFEEHPELFEKINIPSTHEIKERAKEFLTKMGRYPEELAQGKENIIFFAYDASSKEFKKVNRPSEANAVEIDLYRPDLDGVSTVYPKYFNSANYVVMTLKDEEYKVIKAQIKFFEKEDARYGIYPLRSGAQALADLKQQKGLIVSAGANNNNIIIKKMFLGYLDPDKYHPYLEPVYVFLGDKGFVAYLQAVKEEYIK